VEVSVIACDILSETPLVAFPPLDVIVSNPPYVRQSEKSRMERNVLDYEPEIALFVEDSDPLLFYKHIADFALIHLKTEGRLYFEINEAFGMEYVEMLHEKGFFDVELRKDINGKDRMVRGIVMAQQ
jgi:release factor glutamine methyltransferase